MIVRGAAEIDCDDRICCAPHKHRQRLNNKPYLTSETFSLPGHLQFRLRCNSSSSRSSCTRASSRYRPANSDRAESRQYLRPLVRAMGNKTMMCTLSPGYALVLSLSFFRPFVAQHRCEILGRADGQGTDSKLEPPTHSPTQWRSECLCQNDLYDLTHPTRGHCSPGVAVSRSPRSPPPSAGLPHLPHRLLRPIIPSHDTQVS